MCFSYHNVYGNTKYFPLGNYVTHVAEGYAEENTLEFIKKKKLELHYLVLNKEVEEGERGWCCGNPR